MLRPHSLPGPGARAGALNGVPGARIYPARQGFEGGKNQKSRQLEARVPGHVQEVPRAGLNVMLDRCELIYQEEMPNERNLAGPVSAGHALGAVTGSQPGHRADPRAREAA